MWFVLETTNDLLNDLTGGSTFDPRRTISGIPGVAFRPIFHDQSAGWSGSGVAKG
jgi:hypothetical protein